MTLADSRRTSGDIKQRLEQGQLNQDMIDEVRQVYSENICERLSHMFGCLNDMELVDLTYQFSLRHFLNTFQAALEYLPEGEDEAESALVRASWWEGLRFLVFMLTYCKMLKRIRLRPMCGMRSRMLQAMWLGDFIQ